MVVEDIQQRPAASQRLPLVFCEWVQVLCHLSLFSVFFYMNLSPQLLSATRSSSKCWQRSIIYRDICCLGKQGGLLLHLPGTAKGPGGSGRDDPNTGGCSSDASRFQGLSSFRPAASPAGIWAWTAGLTSVCSHKQLCRHVISACIPNAVAWNSCGRWPPTGLHQHLMTDGLQQTLTPAATDTQQC